MEFKVAECCETGERTYTIKITSAELTAVKFTNFDWRLFADCEKEGATLADKVLALETLTRRIEEQT